MLVQHVLHAVNAEPFPFGVGKQHIVVISLWLGHESVETTQIYLAATLAMKEKALAKTTPRRSRPGRYRPGDSLLAFLNDL